MDITDIKKILSEIYREKVGLPLREGSPIMDKLINPLSYLLSPFYDDVNALSNTIAFADADITTAKLYASNFFVDIGNGSKSGGDIYIYVTERQDLTVPVATTFYTDDGLSFYPDREYVFVGAQLIEEDGIYRTPAITVIAEDVGSQYNISANKISGSSISGYTIYEVTNPEPFTGGVDCDDVDRIIDIVKNSRNTRILDTGAGIDYILRANYSSIYNLTCVGNGDSAMIRDISYLMSSGSNIITESSYANKISGDTINNTNTAFKGINDSLSPSISQFVDELTTSEYADIAYDNGRSTKYQSGDIFSDDFSRTDENGILLDWTDFVGNGWKVGNTGDILSKGKTLEAIKIEKDNGVYYSVLGGSYTAQGELNPIQQSEMTKQIADAIIKAGYVGKIDLDIADIVKNVNIQNIHASPTMQHGIGAYQGIKINGSFKTNDDGSDDRPFYMTVCRDSNATTATAYEGFGLAVMPKKSDTLPNVFIVDNDSVDSDYMIVGQRMINPNAIEDFLVAKTVDIQANTLYHYEMRFNAPSQSDERNAVSLDAYIWADGQDKPDQPTISYGMYVPIKARKWGYDGGTLSPVPYDFGFGIGDTQGYQWWFGPVTVTNVSQEYAQMLFKMDVSKLSQNFSLYVSYSGSGGNAGTENNGAAVYLYNHATTTWDLFSENDGEALLSTAVEVDKTDYVDNNEIAVLITSKYPHDTTNILPIYSSVTVNNIRLYEYTGIVHTGGKIDVYIKHAPDSNYKPYTEGVVIVDSPSIHYLPLSNDFIHPIMRVKEVDVLDNTGAVLSVLSETTDYRFIYGANGTMHSTKENCGIVFNNDVTFDDSLKIVYDYIDDVVDIQSFVESTSEKVLGNDLLIKHKDIYYADISITVDSVDDNFEKALREYVYTIESVLDLSDIINLAYKHQATYVSTDISVTMTWYDSYGNKFTEDVEDKFNIKSNECIIAESITITNT